MKLYIFFQNNRPTIWMSFIRDVLQMKLEAMGWARYDKLAFYIDCIANEWIWYFSPFESNYNLHNLYFFFFQVLYY